MPEAELVICNCRAYIVNVTCSQYLKSVDTETEEFCKGCNFQVVFKATWCHSQKLNK